MPKPTVTKPKNLKIKQKTLGSVGKTHSSNERQGSIDELRRTTMSEEQEEVSLVERLSTFENSLRKRAARIERDNKNQCTPSSSQQEVSS